MKIDLMGASYDPQTTNKNVAIMRFLSLLTHRGFSIQEAIALIYLTNLVDNFREWVSLFGWRPHHVVAQEAYTFLPIAKKILEGYEMVV